MYEDVISQHTQISRLNAIGISQVLVSHSLLGFLLAGVCLLGLTAVRKEKPDKSETGRSVQYILYILLFETCIRNVYWDTCN
ncbi:hypothetical protein B0I72DRAFT_132834 [Yarrowia lipolytica]|nr:hypothetical protein B0I72DRAFT_132834 [Yarrowia lipolytica]